MDPFLTTRKRPAIAPHVRWMIRRDMPEILSIEQACFAEPWVEGDFIQCLREGITIGMVVEVKDRVCAFMVYRLQKKSLHVLNFAVDPLWQRIGLGRAMVDKLVSKLSGHRRATISMDTSERNGIAHLFLRANRFLAIEVTEGFYDDGAAAYRFEYTMESDE